MDKLTKLAIEYGTDKYGKHNYTPVYYKMFHKHKKRFKKIIEIGIAEGAGARMFRDFFPNAVVYGAEIDDNRMIEEERIHTIKCDQSSEDDLINLIKETGSDIDLVVDDGSHVPDHQVFSCLKLMPQLDKGVTYIIEDVADEGIVRWLDEYNVEVKRVGSRYDDRLVIVRHAN